MTTTKPDKALPFDQFVLSEVEGLRRDHPTAIPLRFRAAGELFRWLAGDRIDIEMATYHLVQFGPRCESEQLPGEIDYIDSSVLSLISPESPGPTPGMSSCAVSTFVYNGRSDRFFNARPELIMALADEAGRCVYWGICRAANRLEQAEIGGIEQCVYII